MMLSSVKPYQHRAVRCRLEVREATGQKGRVAGFRVVLQGNTVRLGVLDYKAGVLCLRKT